MRFQILIRRAWLSASILTATACASASGGGSSGVVTSNPNVLSAAEISSSSSSQATVYEAIQRLRPAFLQTRGHTGTPNAGEVLTSVDGGPLSTVDVLRSVNASQVREIRFLSASDAAQRFGVRANSGPVILVTQK